MMQANFNRDFLNERKLIAPYLKKGECPADVLNGDDNDLRSAFRNILNHYEFLSAGIRNGDFDEKLVKDSERGTYIALYTCCERHIWNLRDGRQRMTIYEHLEWIHRRWHKEPPNKAIRVIEWVRGRPIYGKLGGDRN